MQPFLNIRALTHDVVLQGVPGLKAAVRMEGDTFEMEDHRNWTDASFKTYVRPLARPWPYVLEAGQTVRQQVSLTLVGTAPATGASSSSSSTSKAIEVTLGRETGDRIPTIGLGMPAEEIEAATAALPLLERAAPKLLICQFDPRQGHGLRELDAYRVLCSKTRAACELEVVIESVDDFAAELEKLAALVKSGRARASSRSRCVRPAT